MSRFGKGTRVVMMLSVGAWIALAEWAPGADRTAEQILKELDAVKAPAPEAMKKPSQAALRRARAKQHEAWARRDALILDLPASQDRREVPLGVDDEHGR